MISVSIVQIILYVYYSLTKLVDLYPFNNVREYSKKERLLDPGFKGILLFIPPVAFCFASIPMMFVSLIIYFYILIIEFKKWWLALAYCILFIIMPLVYIFYKLFEANSVNDFHRLSRWIKLVMLAGILSMIFFYIYL